MPQPDFQTLDLNIARARIVLSLLAMLSVYVDPTTAGGLFHLTGLALATLLCHLAYSVTLYLVLRPRPMIRFLPAISIALDLLFATAIAFLTEGQTSPSYVFFVFAIIAVGVRAIPGLTIAVTLISVSLYLFVVALSDGMTDFYLMRAVYLAIAGYLIGFVGQQRMIFETELRRLATRAQRLSIARSLHDGYVQTLAGVNLRLETCRELFTRARPADALNELNDLQIGVAREYDEVRAYIRALAEVGLGEPTTSVTARDLRCRLRCDFAGRGDITEHIFQIMLEGLRNARRHGLARSVEINLSNADNKIHLTIEDDGIGFADAETTPWAIASRVAEMGGRFTIVSNASPARLAIEVPDA